MLGMQDILEQVQSVKDQETLHGYVVTRKGENAYTLGVVWEGPEQEAETFEVLHEGDAAFIAERIYYLYRRDTLANRDIEISGVVSIDCGLDEFLDRFIEWVESNGWSFCGGAKEITEENENADDDSSQL
jgi:hypothetical protein